MGADPGKYQGYAGETSGGLPENGKRVRRAGADPQIAEMGQIFCTKRYQSKNPVFKFSAVSHRDPSWGSGRFFLFWLTAGENPVAGMGRGVLWMIGESGCGYMVIKVLVRQRRKRTEKELLPFFKCGG